MKKIDTIKKLTAFLLLAFSVLMLSSCSSSAESELKNRLIIEGIGVDFDNENNKFDLTVQVLVTSHSGGKEAAAENPVQNYSASGRTIAEALNDLGSVTGKNPLYSQNRVIVLGDSLNGKNMIKALDHFAREYTARADIYITAASGKASDILTVSEGGGEITAKLIESALDESFARSTAVDTELFNVVNLSLEENTCFTMPLLEVDSDSKLGGKAIKVTGTYVYSEEGEQNRLSDKETMFFLMVMNKAENGTFSIRNDEAEIGLDIIRSKTKIKTDFKNGKPYYEIKIDSDVDLIEYDTAKFGNLKRENVDSAAKEAEDYIENGIKELLERELKDEKSDIFRFGRRFMQKFPDEYEKIKDNWQDTLPEIEYDVKAEVTVRRIGQETMKGV